MYTQSNDTTPTQPTRRADLVVSGEPSAVSAVPRAARAWRRLPGGTVLAKLVDDPAIAPGWLKMAAATLEAAGRPERSLQARAADMLRVLLTLDQLYTTRLPEVQQWFEGAAAMGHTLDNTLPHWTETLYAESGALLRQHLLPELAATGIEILPVIRMDERQRAWLHRYFTQSVYPLLTPLAVDPGRPFPFISSDSLNLLVELRRPDAVTAGLRGERATFFARVKIQSSIPRLVAIPSEIGRGLAAADGHVSSQFVSPSSPRHYVCRADLVRFFVHHLFTGMPVHHVYLFRVMRGEHPLPGVGGRAGRQRRQEDRPVVRLDVERRMPDPVLCWLMEHLHLPGHGVVHHDSLLESTCLPAIVALLHETRVH